MFARPIVLSLALLGVTATAWAEDSQFAVVDLSPGVRSEALVPAVEREIARLRPSTQPIDDPAMRTLLASGEGPQAAAVRLTREAQARREAGDCAVAVDKARAAEKATLSSVSLDDERPLLRSIYVVLVICEHERGRAAERDDAARRLRDLVSLPPSGMPQELWDKHVAGATWGPATTELQVDSDPPNAQISVNFHGHGVTPRTLKVAPGKVYVEVQKDGFLKGFRLLEVGRAPTRAAFRLINRTHDRLDQALAALKLLGQGDPAERPRTISHLAQLARAELVVLLRAENDRVKIWFFDAERGALSQETIESAFDPTSGRVEALAARPTPAAPEPSPPVAPVPAASGLPKAAPPPEKPAAAGLPESQAETKPVEVVRRKKNPAPWWGWLIAGALGASLGAFILLDRPETPDTLAVRAYWVPPGP